MVKTALKGQPLNDVQLQVGEGSLTIFGVSCPGEICPIVEALVGSVQARCRGEQDGQPSKAQTLCCHQGPPPAGLCKPGLTKDTKQDGECTFVEGHHSEQAWRLCDHSSSCQGGLWPKPSSPCGSLQHPGALQRWSQHGAGKSDILIMVIFLGCKYRVCSFPNAQKEYLLVAKPFLYNV